MPLSANKEYSCTPLGIERLWECSSQEPPVSCENVSCKSCSCHLDRPHYKRCDSFIRIYLRKASSGPQAKHGAGKTD